MKLISKVFGEIFDFFCGDWTIFWGMVVTIFVVILINSFPMVANLKVFTGIFFILGISFSFIIAIKKEVNLK